MNMGGLDGPYGSLGVQAPLLVPFTGIVAA
jgi:hypothetical protein